MYYKSKLYISGLNLDPWMEGDLKAHMTAVLEGRSPRMRRSRSPTSLAPGSADSGARRAYFNEAERRVIASAAEVAEHKMRLAAMEAALVGQQHRLEKDLGRVAL